MEQFTNFSPYGTNEVSGEEERKNIGGGYEMIGYSDKGSLVYVDKESNNSFCFKILSDSVSFQYIADEYIIIDQRTGGWGSSERQIFHKGIVVDDEENQLSPSGNRDIVMKNIPETDMKVMSWGSGRRNMYQRTARVDQKFNNRIVLLDRIVIKQKENLKLVNFLIELGEVRILKNFEVLLRNRRSDVFTPNISSGVRFGSFCTEYQNFAMLLLLANQFDENSSLYHLSADVLLFEILFSHFTEEEVFFMYHPQCRDYQEDQGYFRSTTKEIKEHIPRFEDMIEKRNLFLSSNIFNAFSKSFYQTIPQKEEYIHREIYEKLISILTNISIKDILNTKISFGVNEESEFFSPKINKVIIRITVSNILSIIVSAKSRLKRMKENAIIGNIKKMEVKKDKDDWGGGGGSWKNQQYENDSSWGNDTEEEEENKQSILIQEEEEEKVLENDFLVFKEINCQPPNYIVSTELLLYYIQNICSNEDDRQIFFKKKISRFGIRNSITFFEMLSEKEFYDVRLGFLRICKIFYSMIKYYKDKELLENQQNINPFATKKDPNSSRFSLRIMILLIQFIQQHKEKMIEDEIFKFCRFLILFSIDDCSGNVEIDFFNILSSLDPKIMSLLSEDQKIQSIYKLELIPRGKGIDNNISSSDFCLLPLTLFIISNHTPKKLLDFSSSSSFLLELVKSKDFFFYLSSITKKFCHVGIENRSIFFEDNSIRTEYTARKDENSLTNEKTYYIQLGLILTLLLHEIFVKKKLHISIDSIAVEKKKFEEILKIPGYHIYQEEEKEQKEEEDVFINNEKNNNKEEEEEEEGEGEMSVEEELRYGSFSMFLRYRLEEIETFVLSSKKYYSTSEKKWRGNDQILFDINKLCEIFIEYINWGKNILGFNVKMISKSCERVITLFVNSYLNPRIYFSRDIFYEFAMISLILNKKSSSSSSEEDESIKKYFVNFISYILKWSNQIQNVKKILFKIKEEEEEEKERIEKKKEDIISTIIKKKIFSDNLLDQFEATELILQMIWNYKKCENLEDKNQVLRILSFLNLSDQDIATSFSSTWIGGKKNDVKESLLVFPNLLGTVVNPETLKIFSGVCQTSKIYLVKYTQQMLIKNIVEIYQLSFINNNNNNNSDINFSMMNNNSKNVEILKKTKKEEKNNNNIKIKEEEETTETTTTSLDYIFYKHLLDLASKGVYISEFLELFHGDENHKKFKICLLKKLGEYISLIQEEEEEQQSKKKIKEEEFPFVLDNNNINNNNNWKSSFNDFSYNYNNNNKEEENLFMLNNNNNNSSSFSFNNNINNSFLNKEVQEEEEEEEEEEEDNIIISKKKEKTKEQYEYHKDIISYILEILDRMMRTGKFNIFNSQYPFKKIKRIMTICCNIFCDCLKISSSSSMFFFSSSSLSNSYFLIFKENILKMKNILDKILSNKNEKQQQQQEEIKKKNTNQKIKKKEYISDIIDAKEYISSCIDEVDDIPVVNKVSEVYFEISNITTTLYSSSSSSTNNNNNNIINPTFLFKSLLPRTENIKKKYDELWNFTEKTKKEKKEEKKKRKKTDEDEELEDIDNNNNKKKRKFSIPPTLLGISKVFFVVSAIRNNSLEVIEFCKNWFLVIDFQCDRRNLIVNNENLELYLMTLGYLFLNLKEIKKINLNNNNNMKILLEKEEKEKEEYTPVLMLEYNDDDNNNKILVEKMRHVIFKKYFYYFDNMFISELGPIRSSSSSSRRKSSDNIISGIIKQEQQEQNKLPILALNVMKSIISICDPKNLPKYLKLIYRIDIKTRNEEMLSESNFFLVKQLISTFLERIDFSEIDNDDDNNNNKEETLQILKDLKIRVDGENNNNNNNNNIKELEDQEKYNNNKKKEEEEFESFFSFNQQQQQQDNNNNNNNNFGDWFNLENNNDEEPPKQFDFF